MASPETSFWFQQYSTLIEVAQYAVDVGLLSRPGAVVDFFEKPHHYDNLFDEYMEHRDDPD